MRTKTIAVETRLDHLAKELYGSERNGSVELLLDANPGLAAEAGVVPPGWIIVVPDLPARALDVVSPWS